MPFKTRSDGKRIGPVTLEWIISKCSVDPKTGCWIWTMQKFWDGYGRVKSATRAERVHRVVWTLVHGQIPDSIKILHKCDNPPCCNPDHLFDGTHSDNARDASSKGRLLWNALLPHVLEIRSSQEDPKLLASKFRVTPTAIRAIRNRQSYKWI